MSSIRVVLIEDHDLTRMGMKIALQQQGELVFVGEAATGAEGVSLVNSQHPDVAIVDLGLPDMDGVEVTRQIKAAATDAGRATKVLILTLTDSQETVLAAFAAGADSYCIKDISSENLVQALKLTAEGNSWIDPAIASIVLQQVRRREATVEIDAAEADYKQVLAATPLTERELEVLSEIVNGNSNAEIAERLYITVGTVKTHVRNILNKLCADDRTQAAVRALRAGLVK
ncbi:MAG: response regulator [Pseudanabaena sp.]|jgi:DNA-binding NarL/FixJ family response regulator|uniref:response regulator n=1 Tax=unclassified Pseudanabaena TaxID=2593292 RepID=UPI000CD88339|nr:MULTISPECIES: response regulator transcription factor [unclassified Pseudanabaena]MCA6510876.1 response regulator transcription factor [Pseudanabaena sp. M109S1SP2A07QC]MCA6519077.1 response regulator transcription factor [Pseudanabaena sp. M110S1SP2A07QC]MCA6522332.1 response regulator transcription factor [Pseudanabaena sp. M051S1SP2A07QC]MCA6527818.1 response regulator transcription factor [Pseudanabaena sp. M179S2SP2A07QC]MCA6529649.1 response regulator transcription factor [Pseudanabae